MSPNKRDSIFISHRSVDAELADMIQEYLVGCGVPIGKIFCSSLPGNDVDTVIPMEIKQKLKESAVNIVILSKDYYDSAFCLNEAGVIWFLEDDADVILVGLPEISESNMIGFIDRNTMLRRLNTDTDISKIIDIVKKKLYIQDLEHTVIIRQTNKLINRYNDYIKKRGNCNLSEEAENPVVVAIRNFGTEANIDTIAQMTGPSTIRINELLKKAISEGRIEIIGSTRKLYKIIKD